MSREAGAALRSALESPAEPALAPQDLCSDRRVPVRGFAYAPGLGPLRVRARLGSGPWVKGLADDFRDDVAAREPLCAEAVRSGFGLLVPAGAASGALWLRVEALLPEGPAVFCLRELVLPEATQAEPDPGLGPPSILPAGAPRAAREPAAGARPVLFISQDLALEGSQRSLLELSRSLDRRRFRPRWLSAQDGPMAALLASQGIPLDLRPLRPRPRGDGERTALLRSYVALPEIQRVELVVANTLQSFWGLELARMLGVPSAWIVRESVDPVRFLHRHWPARSAEEALGFFGRVDRLVFVSPTTARRYLGFATPDRIAVIPNGVDCEAFGGSPSPEARELLRRQVRTELGLPPGARLLLCPGTVCGRKGQRVLLEALAAVAREHGDLHALLLGARPHPYVDALRAAAERLGLSGRVHWLPRRSDPRPLFLASDIAVCPSLQESLPRVVLEAMACGLPIAASAVDGIPELLRDGREGLLLPPGEPDPLARALRLLLGDPVRAAALGSAAQKRALAEFPLERCTERFQSLFDELLEESPD